MITRIPAHPLLSLLPVLWLAFTDRSPADELDLPAAALQRCKAATVLVDLGHGSSGTGFLVHSSGLFITNRHVADEIPPGSIVKLVLEPGQPHQKVIKARVAVISQEEDLALLKTDDPVSAEPLPLADETGVVELAKTVVFGYPFGKMLAAGNGYPAISVNVGRISALRREGESLDRIQLDAATNPGNSGGPLIDKDGKVIGVIVSGIRGANVNFAIPAAKVSEMLREPILSLRGIKIPYASRTEVRDFEIEVFPTTPLPPNPEISFSFQEPASPARAFPVVREGGKLLVKAAPIQLPGANGSLRLHLEATFGQNIIRTNLDDCELHASARALRFSEVREITKSKNAMHTTLARRAGDEDKQPTIDGALDGLPILHSDVNDFTLNLRDADRIKVIVYDPGAIRVPYELVMTAQGKRIATSRGEIVFTDPPEDSGEDGDPRVAAVLRRAGLPIVGRERKIEGTDFSSLIDPERDTREGTWEWRQGALQTRAEPAAWCEIPVLPGDDYRCTVKFTPQEKAKGELLVQLPLEKGCALLHFDGEKGRIKLELADDALSDDEESEGKAAPFEAGKERALSVVVMTHGEYVSVTASAGKEDDFEWVGRVRQLVKSKQSPVQRDRLAIGHHSLAMVIDSVRLEATKGPLRIRREFPSEIVPPQKDLVGHWTMDHAPASGKIESAGKGVTGIPIGNPQFGSAPSIDGRGAMKLTGADLSGLQLEENRLTNQGPHPNRTLSLWFRADHPEAKDKKQYLYDGGGALKGASIYLEDGTLFAGAWELGSNWKGTWLQSPGIQADKWYHLALVLDGDAKEKEKAMRLYLDGKLVAEGWGGPINGGHEELAFGTWTKTVRSSEDPANKAAKRGFAGMIDEVLLFNTPLTEETVKLLAALRFSAGEAAK